MSKLLGTACLAIALASATVVHASDLPWRLSLEGSLSKPVARFGDLSDNGNHFNVSIDRELLPELLVGVDLGRHAWNANDSWNNQVSITKSLQVDPTFQPLVDTPIVHATVRDEVMQYTAHAKYVIPMSNSPVEPYLVGGLGGYTVRNSIEVVGASTEKHDNSFLGYNAGGGLDYALAPNTKLGVNAAYHFIPSKSRIGEDITSVAFGAHVSYAFGR